VPDLIRSANKQCCVQCRKQNWLDTDSFICDRAKAAMSV